MTSTKQLIQCSAGWAITFDYESDIDGKPNQCRLTAPIIGWIKMFDEEMFPIFVDRYAGPIIGSDKNIKKLLGTGDYETVYKFNEKPCGVITAAPLKVEQQNYRGINDEDRALIRHYESQGRRV